MPTRMAKINKKEILATNASEDAKKLDTYTFANRNIK